MHCKYIHSLVILIYFDSVSPFCVMFLLALLHIECLKGTVSSGLMKSDTGGEDSNCDLQLPKCAKAAVREIRCNSQQRTGILTSQTRTSGARSAQSCAKTQSKQHGQQTVDPWTTRVLTWLKTRFWIPYEVDKLQLLVLVVQPPVWSQPCPQQTASISFQDIRQFQKNIPCVIIVHDILSYFMIFHQYVHISPHIIYVPCHAIWSQDSENQVKQVNQAAMEDPKWTRSKAESNEPNWATP
jgi:hypothetical protein